MSATLTRAPTKALLTAEDFAVHPDEKHSELVDGKLVEKQMGALSNWIAGEIFGYLREFCRANRVGLPFVESAYQCFAKTNAGESVRRPDVSFVRIERMPEGPLGDGYLKIHPDLAVEVLSPNDNVIEVERKIKQYLDTGIPLVWVVIPETRAVRIHRADGSITGLREDDELSGEDVVPGFRVRVGELFMTPLTPEAKRNS